MTTTIKRLSTRDIRFPTSQGRHGSDAMNPDPDYSAVYVTLETDSELTGHGIVFTLGRGNEICKAVVDSLARFVSGVSLCQITQDMRKFWRTITSDSQMRWLGPDKGVVHLATAAVVNAIWDLWAKAEAKPLWKLLVDMSPEQLVSCIDFRYITDAMTANEAIEILADGLPQRADRETEIVESGFPAYTTSAGWLGYSDEQIVELCKSGMADGWNHFKIKVGADRDQDVHRLELVRNTIGGERKLMLDANQVWDVDEAIDYMSRLARFDPWWIEEPTNPDDILGHARIAEAIKPIGVATGEMCQNRIVFKQLMQARAVDFCQIDSCRLGGVNEVLSVILMAKKFQIPVCPHGGGVGLCEHIQHLSFFDYICVSQSTENRVAEYVDHLHEHFVHPTRIRNGHYLVPTAPGYSIEMNLDSLDAYDFPNGPVWQEILSPNDS